MNTEVNVVQSPFRDVLVPRVDMWNLMKQSFESHGNQTAIIDSESGHRTTYTDLLIVSYNVAADLWSKGLDPSRPVIIFMRSSIQFVITCLAVWRLGGHLMCVNSLLTSNEVQSVLEMIPCDVIVCDDDQSQVVHKAVVRHGTEKKVILKSSLSRCLSPHKPCNKSVSSDYVEVLKGASVTDTAVILLSSGTTGRSKGVEITHRALVGQTFIWSSPELGNIPRGAAILYQPFSHIYGFTLMLIHLTMGVPFVLMESFSLNKFIEHILHYKPEQLHLVPPIAVLLCQNATLRQHDLSFVRSISSGGAPMVGELYTKLRDVFTAGLAVRQLYGLTEAAGGCLGVPFSRPCPAGSIGWPFPNVKAKVVHLKDGSALGANQTGELCVKSEFFMRSYLESPVATREAIDELGWLHTGDLAYYDSQGCFFVVDRLKELIKFKGYQVAPAELESVLMSHPDVQDAGVTGVPHSTWGEVPLAWVVRRTGSLLAESELSEFVNKQVASFKRLEGGLFFVKQIPKSASGKILRREIKHVMLARDRSSKL